MTQLTSGYTNIVTLNQPLPYAPAPNRLRIDVYETGNGDQLVKANTETDPLRLNTVTGFQEIYVNANYTAGIYQGSGVIRPTTEPQQVTATSTNASGSPLAKVQGSAEALQAQLKPLYDRIDTLKSNTTFTI